MTARVARRLGRLPS